ncbi:MAG: response regulator transcription factor [Ilumatobacteraceae bacterium]
MPARHILVVDDDPDLTDLVRELLHGEGHSISVAPSGERAEQIARARTPDLIILDVDLPGMKGPEVCRRLREFSTAPILFLTAASSESDQIVGFTAGADDYVTKPFGPQVLLARVRTLLARGTRSTSGPKLIANVQIDANAQVVTVDGTLIELTKTEYDVLTTLAARDGHIISKVELLREVWGEWFGDDHVIEVTISRLRTKLIHAGAPERLITTHRGLGYRISAPR